MKRIIFLLLVFLLGISLFSQDQTINGNLTTIGNIVLRTNQIPAAYGEWGKRLYFGAYPVENSDAIYLSRVNIRNDHSELRMVLGDDSSEKFIIGFISYVDGLWKEGAVFRANGFVGIKVSDPTCELDVNGSIKGKKLDINGTIRSKEVKIEATGWSDFVFNKDYKLLSLLEVENHINEKGTLPDIPSENEVKEKGINVAEMQAKLLQKIEELTLYVIELKKENEAQNILIQQLQDVK